jgi:sugar phosphate isomerase/epimerase
MDLPVNFPPGTRFWQLIIDAVAAFPFAITVSSDMTTGEFMLLDGSLVGGDRAKRLRRQIKRDGLEISERAFRQMAPPSLAEKIKAIEERAKRDLEYAKALGTALAMEPGLIEKCERVALDLLRNADQKWHLEGAKLLLKIAAKKQNVAWQ